MSKREDREFQLELLKIQIKHQALWSSVTLLIAAEFAAFTSVATTFLGFGLTSGNTYYSFVGAFTFVILYFVVRGTTSYLQRKTAQRELDRELEVELQPIRDRFMTKKRKKRESRKEQQARA